MTEEEREVENIPKALGLRCWMSLHETKSQCSEKNGQFKFGLSVANCGSFGQKWNVWERELVVLESDQSNCINLEGKGFSDRNLKDTEIKRQEIHRWVHEGN